MAITVSVTLLNYMVIIYSVNIIDIVKDFLAIKVISELDDYFLNEHIGKDEICMRLVTEEGSKGVFKIETTTSRDARLIEDKPNSNKFTPEADSNWIQSIRG